MNKPKLSIVTPCYNHEKYIDDFMASVFAQTEKNFELIIVDDCSNDATIEKLLKYDDRRIKIIKHSWNQGINATISDGIEEAVGDVVCTIASDDMLSPDYVAAILEDFDKHDVGVVYVTLKKIDAEGKSLGEYIHLPIKKNRYEILRDSFIGVNQVPSPGMAMRTNIVKKLLPLPSGIIQYSDWALHNDLMLRTNIFLDERELIFYRVSPNGASARSSNVFKREALETDILLNTFLNIKDVSVFKSIFKDHYEQYGEPVVETIPYFLARIALTSDDFNKQSWGYRLLIKFYSENNNRKKLYDLYGVQFKNVINLVNDIVLYDTKPLKKVRKKYLKYKIISFILCVLLLTMLFLFIVW